MFNRYRFINLKTNAKQVFFEKANKFVTFIHVVEMKKRFRKKITNKKSWNGWETILSINRIIFDMDEDRIIQSVNLIATHILDNIYPLSFNIIITQMIYESFSIDMDKSTIYLNLLKEIQSSIKKNSIKSNFFDVFLLFLLNKNTQEGNYLLEAMIEHKLLEPKFIKNNSYFVHRMKEDKIKNIYYVKFMDQIINNYEELSKNDWELHKQLIKEGHNPNEIAKIIRNDEIEKLQEISSQTNFNFNQTIEPSLYERCSFINQENVTLIDYAAFFSAVKCFKYLLMNGSKVNKTGKYAIAGGNIEIIHLCEQNHLSFNKAYKIAIEFHRNDIFKYIYENKIIRINNISKLGRYCILYHNYEIFSFLKENGMKINNSIINESARIGNIYLVEHFLIKNKIPKNILVFSSQSHNIELVKYILNQNGIDINAKDIFGRTALMYVSFSGETEIIKLLLEQKCIDVNTKDKVCLYNFLFVNSCWNKFILFWTALMIASQKWIQRNYKITSCS